MNYSYKCSSLSELQAFNYELFFVSDYHWVSYKYYKRVLSSKSLRLNY
jgi:hypothetical protein